MIDLQQFCAAEGGLYALHRPFTKDGYTYATDGAICVRVDAVVGVGPYDGEPVPRVERCFEGLAGLAFAPLRHAPLPPVPEPREEICADHNDAADDDCAGYCPYCDGTGVVMETERVSTTIGGANFGLRYLRRILALPDVEVAIAGLPIDAGDRFFIRRQSLLFRFAGGVGALAPLSGPYADHVEIEVAG